MPKQQRLTPKLRTEQILEAAVTLAADKGLAAVTRDAVADRAGCARGLVTLRFGTMTQLRRALMRRAVLNKNLRVIGMGIAAGDKVALAVPPALAKESAAALV